MQLFILRHGDASREAATDRDRPLTARGRQELHQVLLARQNQLRGVTHLFVSPYVRAQQTALVAAEYLSAGVITAVEDCLVPEADPARLFTFLDAQREQNVGAALVVSHQPLLGIFFDRLCGFDTGRYRLSTSALAAVETDVVAAGLGELQWLSQPVDFI